MGTPRINRVLCFAVFVMTAAVSVRAKNLGEMAADLLRNGVTGYSPARADDGKYHLIVLYNNSPLSDTLLRDDDVEAQQKKVTPGDVYTQLARLDAAERNRIQCVILVDLQPHQVIAAEQFARERKVVIAAVILPFSPDIERGSVPFILDVPQQVALMRSAAVRYYGLELTSMPPRGITELTRESRFQNIDRCPPLLPDDEGAYPHVACHDNAFKRIDDKSSWHDGVRDLDAAVLLRFDEQYDGRVFPRGWGFRGYHPHIGLADYLSRYGNCPGAQRELKIAKLPKDSGKKAELERRITSQCTAPAVIGAADSGATPAWSILARDDDGVVDAELFPPIKPALLWSEIAMLR